MSNDILTVDTGVATFVTLVGFAAHMVEHVLLGETDRLQAQFPLSLLVPRVHSLGVSVDIRARLGTVPRERTCCASPVAGLPSD